MRCLILISTTFALAPFVVAETKNYDLPPFTEINVSDGIELDFTANAPQTVRVENADGDFSDIELTVRNGMLDVDRPTRSGLMWARPDYVVTVTAPTLSRLDVSSGADVTGGGLSGDEVFVEISSGGSATLIDVDGTRVDLETNNGADLIASGRCDELVADASAGSDLDASNVLCQFGRADASSGADIAMHVSQIARAEASSGADIVIYGTPVRVEQEARSGGDITLIE